ncbi:ABC transporter ATP-binding protein [Aestuariimicrobium sp. T2.26MG-19.2B]|uniref:ABC transporter ATP-binding protein n=1 Tax=Aestuariimicrobium sp. T2.26MG-19.2B TaxID=3040679 RepID=UPI00247770DC|nr:ABC transporter ATP-binding protein [Aestuariimicrobium sp. T2.26MG-19.2B]CAI9404597.1 Fatty acid ABC transporter ATP-binding/permease protein [Aestuariimicrobium sp. T2.26MG-19.2B]
MSDSQKTPAANQRSEIAETARKAGAQGHGPGIGRVNEKAVAFGPSLKRLLGRFGEHKPAAALVVVMAMLGVAFNVVGPKILGRATDYIVAGVVGKQFPAGISKEALLEQLRVAGQADLADLISKLPLVPGLGINTDKLLQILGIALGLYVVSALLMVGQGWILNHIVNRGIYQLRRDVSEKLDSLPLSYFDSQPRGELLSRVTNDIDNVATTLQQTVQQLLNSVLMVIGVLVMMLWVDPWLTLITVLIIPVSGVIAGVIGKRSQVQFAGMWKATGELNQHIEESFSGHSLVKVFGRQREIEQEFSRRNTELRRASFGGQFLSGIMMPVMFFVGNLNYVAIAVVGGLMVASGRLPLGDVQAFIQYSRMFTQPITQLASMANLLQSGVASAERVFEVLDADEITPESHGTLPVTQGEVEFEHVRFSYTPDRPLISDLTLSVEPGQTVAIVGPTGAGKTTLVNLLMRFYELDGGRILLDGVDVASVPRSALRSKLGMVLQDTWLFGGTIRENIRYGRPDATDAEVEAAARATYVERFVHSLPDGYETVIDDEGSNISAGEKQLITIARAFLADPALLILDEATSSVDTRTEVLVQQAMNALRTGRTSFVIAHRLSTIRDADLILVMEHGAIVEQGSHEELLTSRGHYYELYQSQFAAAGVVEGEEVGSPTVGRS